VRSNSTATLVCTRRAPLHQVFSDDEADIDDVYNANEEQDESGESDQEEATADGEKPGSALLKKALEGDTGEAADDDDDANETAAVSS
jgi:hypothetical protein